MKLKELLKVIYYRTEISITSFKEGRRKGTVEVANKEKHLVMDSISEELLNSEVSSVDAEMNHFGDWGAIDIQVKLV